MPLLSFFAVGIGAFFGALLRWGFGLLWNAVIPNLPLGTLAANLVGGFVIAARSARSNSFRICRWNFACSSPPVFAAA